MNLYENAVPPSPQPPRPLLHYAPPLGLSSREYFNAPAFADNPRRILPLSDPRDLLYSQINLFHLTLRNWSGQSFGLNRTDRGR